MKRISEPVALVVASGAGIVVIWAADHFGLWWVPALVGLAVGLTLRGTLRVIAVASLAAVAAWGLDLGYQSLGVPVGDAARVVATIMGFGQAGAIVVALALVFAWLLGVTGAWVGASLRRAVATLGGRPAATAE